VQHIDVHHFPPAMLKKASATHVLNDALDGLGSHALYALATLRPSECGAMAYEEDDVELPQAPATLAYVKHCGEYMVHPVWSHLDCK
jgi:hypothetical protein